jgi:hypothetical protein
VLRVQSMVAIAAAAVAIAGCGDDEPAGAPSSSEGSPSHRDGGERDARAPGGNTTQAAGDAAVDAARPGSGPGRGGFDFDDFAIDDEDASARARDASVADACAGPDCDVCHGESGETMSCQAHWMCTFEREGGADGCNCGCGALDPDCASETGCSEPGCTAPGCITCRGEDGTPMSCAP